MIIPGFLPTLCTVLCSFYLSGCVIFSSSLEETWLLAQRAQKPYCHHNLTASLPDFLHATSLSYLPLSSGPPRGIYWGRGISEKKGSWLYHFFAEELGPVSKNQVALHPLEEDHNPLALRFHGEDLQLLWSQENNDTFKLVAESLLRKEGTSTSLAIPGFLYASDITLRQPDPSNPDDLLLTGYGEHFLAQLLSPALRARGPLRSWELPYRYVGFSGGHYFFAAPGRSAEQSQLHLRILPAASPKSLSPPITLGLPFVPGDHFALYPLPHHQLISAWVEPPSQRNPATSASLHLMLWDLKNPTQPLWSLSRQLSIADHSELAFFQQARSLYLRFFSSLHTSKVLQILRLPDVKSTPTDLRPQIYGAFDISTTAIDMLAGDFGGAILLRQGTDLRSKTFSLCTLWEESS